MGVLEGRTCWDGQILVSGDIVVPPGSSLLVNPGTEVRFSARPRWSCSVFRSAPEGYPIEASERARCDIVVLGRLDVFGTESAPVVLGGGVPWGGIILLGGARASLRWARIADASEHAIQTFDDAHAFLSRCRLERPRRGVVARGTSNIASEKSTVVGAESGVIACEGSRIELTELSFEDCGQGVSAEGWSLVGASDCRFLRCRDNAVLAKNQAWVRLRPRDVSGEPVGRGVLTLEEARIDR
ncbi:MAG: right-handed parallel beta-helix repeat-containing protein [Elusimicrobia bacterium]|nr:right-handed parallel beta-helix repeat-containing protein [Elusimicrobiota bacterium]